MPGLPVPILSSTGVTIFTTGLAEAGLFALAPEPSLTVGVSEGDQLAGAGVEAGFFASMPEGGSIARGSEADQLAGVGAEGDGRVAIVEATTTAGTNN